MQYGADYRDTNGKEMSKLQYQERVEGIDIGRVLPSVHGEMAWRGFFELSPGRQIHGMGTHGLPEPWIADWCQREVWDEEERPAVKRWILALDQEFMRYIGEESDKARNKARQR